MSDDILGQVPEFAKLVREYSSILEAPANRMLRIEFGDLPKMIGGKHVHLCGLRIRGVCQFDAVAATMPNAMPGYLALSALTNIKFQAANHKFFQGLNGYHLYLDQVLRCGETPEALPSDIADANATDGTVTVDLTLRFDSPKAPASQSDSGCIPIAMLQQFKSDQANNVLEFQVASAFESFAGVTIDGFTSLEVHALLKCFDEKRVITPWAIRREETTEKFSKLSPFGAIEYMVVANTRNTSGSFARDHSTMGGVSIQVGNDQITSNETVARLVRQHEAMRIGQSGALAISESAPEIVPLLVPRYGQYRTKMPRGRVRLDLVTRSAHDYTAVQYRETGRHTEKTLNDFRLAAGIPLDQPLSVHNAKPGKGGAAADILDLKAG